MAEYKLSFTAEEIETSLNDINNLLHYPTITWDEVDNCVLPGYYYIAGTMDIDGFTANYWYLTVSAYTTGLQHCTQILEPIKGTDSYRLRRIKRSEEWQPWEWENPPLAYPINENYEPTRYRTIERYNKKPVYTFTYKIALDADYDNITDYPIHDDENVTVIRYAARTQEHHLPYNLRDDKKFKDFRIRTDGKSFTFERGVDLCGKSDTIFVQLWYIEN